jgi:outer membrane protein OmpA-like peptidoglycan-associated protein
VNTRSALAAATIMAALVGLISAPPSLATGVNDLPAVTEAALSASVSDIELESSDIKLGDSIRDLEQVSEQGGETIVTLTSDILFGSGNAKLPPSATARITALVAKVAKGAALSVGGHTDNVGSTVSNGTLSRARAAAVAVVVAKARPDIRLTVAGFGEGKPVAANESGGKDDPQGRAKNRRVELRYKG